MGEAGGALVEGPRQPNLLFLLTDEQRFDSLPCYGADWVQAPHLDALSEESFVFENAYTPQPVCCPARGAIMTGLWPHTTGLTFNSVPLPPEAQTVAEMLGGAYTCGNFGRWHLGDDVLPQHGFSEWVSLQHSIGSATGRTGLGPSTFHRYLIAQGFEPDQEIDGAPAFSPEFEARLPAQHQTSTFLADHATSFIRDAQEPFFLVVSFHDPHPPYLGPLDDLYDPATLPVGPAFLRWPDADGPFFLRQLAEAYRARTVFGQDLSTEAGWRAQRAHYFGQVTFVDRAIGRILAALEESGLDDDTVVVFSSDHGDTLGDHRLFGKRYLYEPSARVPLMMRVPWLGRSQRLVPGNVSLIDLAPTFLELLGQAVPDHLQGQSRVAALEGEDSLTGNDVFIEQCGLGEGKWEMNDVPWRSIVSADRFKLNLTAFDRCQLFDLNRDPHELRNLIDEPDQRDRIRRLTARLWAWQQETGDTVPLPTIG